MADKRSLVPARCWSAKDFPQIGIECWFAAEDDKLAGSQTTSPRYEVFLRFSDTDNATSVNVRAMRTLPTVQIARMGRVELEAAKRVVVGVLDMPMSKAVGLGDCHAQAVHPGAIKELPVFVDFQRLIPANATNCLCLGDERVGNEITEVHVIVLTVRMIMCSQDSFVFINASQDAAEVRTATCASS